MSPIGLLRHGETVGGPRFRGRRTDDPLTPAGRRTMWGRLETGPAWSAVWSSPLVRCADFARDWSEEHGLPLTIDARLAEMDFGDWEGRSAAEIMCDDADGLAAFWQDPMTHPPPGGESLTAFATRVEAVWDAIRDTSPPGAGPVLVVTHGGVIRWLLARDAGLDGTSLSEIEVPPASLHLIGAPI